MDIKELRQQVEAKLMAWLNDTNQVGGFFECGTYGRVRIWQGRLGWETQWFILKLAPPEVLDLEE